MIPLNNLQMYFENSLEHNKLVHIIPYRSPESDYKDGTHGNGKYHEDWSCEHEDTENRDYCNPQNSKTV